jgi:hypothetical protein
LQLRSLRDFEGWLTEEAVEQRIGATVFRSHLSSKISIAAVAKTDHYLKKTDHR